MREGEKVEGAKQRFSKAKALEALDRRAQDIEKAQRFDRSNGTSQLYPRGTPECECSRIARAVEYGRMRAYEEFACAIEGGCLSKPLPRMGTDWGTVDDRQ